jgi:hypothetical protein
MKQQKPKLLYLAFEGLNKLNGSGLVDLYFASEFDECSILKDVGNLIESSSYNNGKIALNSTCYNGKVNNS